jgi:AraC-like DNA-binding protein
VHSSPYSEAELFNSSMPISNISVWKNWEDRLANTSTFEERIEVSEAFLRAQLRVNPFDQFRAFHAVKLIQEGLTLYKVADEICLSARQIDRVFLQNVGIRPWQYLRISRFQKSIAAFSKCSSLNEFAFTAGYYDAPHFVRECRALSGKSPKEFFGGAPVIADLFL